MNSQDENTTDKEILDVLCAEAPTTNTRTCLRLYDTKKSTKALKSVFTLLTKEKIVETLEYLGMNRSNWDDYIKPACIHELICRVQNLFPEKCDICQETYCVGSGDVPLLHCETCGQGLHDQCIKQVLGNEYDDEMTSEQVKMKINPFNLKSLHIICNGCKELNIPVPEAGLKKTARKGKVGKEDTSQNDPFSLQHSEISGADMGIEINTSVHDTENDDGDDEEKMEKRVCRFYAQGNCKHGRKGVGCSFDHPVACKKLLNHGNKAPSGCNKGKKCDSFHPRMCSTSITRGECFKQECKYVHIKGTKRKKDVSNIVKNAKHKTSPASNKGSNVNKNTENNFLEALQNLKKEMMEAIDIKLATILSMIPTKSLQPPLTSLQPALPSVVGQMQLPWMNPMYAPPAGR